MKCFFNEFAFFPSFQKTHQKGTFSRLLSLFSVFFPQTVISRYTKFGSFKLNGFLFSSYPKYLRFVPTLTTLFSRATFSKTLRIDQIGVCNNQNERNRRIYCSTSQVLCSVKSLKRMRLMPDLRPSQWLLKNKYIKFFQLGNCRNQETVGESTATPY